MHMRAFSKKDWRRLTLPQRLRCSTISAEELNFRVRDGIGWTLFAITTNPNLLSTVWGDAPLGFTIGLQWLEAHWGP